MSPLDLALIALLPVALAILPRPPNCERVDVGDVSEGTHLVLPLTTLAYGSSGRLDIPDYCEAKGLGYGCAERIEACNTNKNGPKPLISFDKYQNKSPVWINCAPGDGCYPGGVNVWVTLYCSQGCLRR